jgi:hypothetical protein
MSLLYRFHRLTPTEQLVVLSAVLDPIGLAGGYLLGPEAGFDPIVGAAGGAMLASMLTSLWFVAGRT